MFYYQGVSGECCDCIKDVMQRMREDQQEAREGSYEEDEEWKRRQSR